MNEEKFDIVINRDYVGIVGCENSNQIKSTQEKRGYTTYLILLKITYG
ncbi:hypothetical protein KPL47_09820 [Clostridium estertheticum]|nr:hypothetical protein [Clostridium estertheticum]MBU3176669.1 hypothetical protein [Clostridium estertheticum]